LRRVTLSRCDGPFGSGLTSSHYTEHGVRVVRLQNIGYAEFKGDDAAFISTEHYATLGDHNVLAGDLLIAGLGDERIPPGRACVAPKTLGPAMVKADCFRFRVATERIIPEFAALFLSATAIAVSSALSSGATRQRINLTSMMTRSIVIPSLQEQQYILRSVGNLSGSIDTTIRTAQREIDLIREYRTRLIADVVTGKLDVRHIGPDIGEELAGPEDLVEDIDDEELLGDDEPNLDEEVADADG